MQQNVSSHSVQKSPEFPVSQSIPAWKRPLDLLLLAVSLPVTGPLMLLLAAWIRLLSSGPAFFVQERIGRNGKRFGCMKFRTMYHGCAASVHEQHLAKLVRQGGPMTKLDAIDPRLIPGARFVRALGLDELPQLINVFRGEMSWVGPRPCTKFEFETYKPEQMERFAALPGLTGLWQVSGKNNTSFQQMVELDIRYTRNPSIFSDIRIMLTTPLVLIGQLVNIIEARRRVRAAAAAAAAAATNDAPTYTLAESAAASSELPIATSPVSVSTDMPA